MGARSCGLTRLRAGTAGLSVRRLVFRDGSLSGERLRAGRVAREVVGAANRLGGALGSLQVRCGGGRLADGRFWMGLPRVAAVPEQALGRARAGMSCGIREESVSGPDGLDGCRAGISRVVFRLSDRQDRGCKWAAPEISDNSPTQGCMMERIAPQLVGVPLPGLQRIGLGCGGESREAKEPTGGQ